MFPKLHPIALPTPFPVGDVNVFLFEDEPLTLIDAGASCQEGYAALEAGLKALGYQVEDIERIILTHHHLDHVGLLDRIKTRSGAQVFGHPGIPAAVALDYSYDQEQHDYFAHMLRRLGAPQDIATETMRYWNKFEKFTVPVEVDSFFKPGEPIGPFHTYPVPGHCSTDTLLIHHEADFTLAGDHILETISPNPLLRRPAPGEQRVKSLLEYEQSLRQSRERDLGRCYPGHGAPFEQHRPIIDRILALHERKKAESLALIPSEGVTPYALARRLFPKSPPMQLFLCLSIALGQLEVMETEGLVRCEAAESMQFFKTINH